MLDALALFERLADLHGLAPSDRDILYAAAILHSIVSSMQMNTSPADQLVT